MGDIGNGHVDPWYVFADLAFAAMVLVQIGVLSVRRWTGQVVPDYSGWSPRNVLTDRRWRFAFALLLIAAWASLAIALIRIALQPEVPPLLASHLGPLPIPPWAALVLQAGHRRGLMYALWATGFWLDCSISKKWSEYASPGGLRTLGFPIVLTLFGLIFSIWD